MSWFKVDDKFHSHKKAARAGTEPLGLWLLCGSWASDQLTDGFVPDYVARRFDLNADALAERLVAAGLWVLAEHDGDQGWRFHDWHTMNPTREESEAKRDYEREKKRRQRARGFENVSRGDDGKFTSPVPILSPGDSHGTEAGHDGESRRESPATRPDPTRTKKETLSSEAADAAPRPDVDEILDYFDRALRTNDPEAKLPTRGKKNSDAARLLLDRDGKTITQVKACIDFATTDEFWRSNIMSMSKLREKYDQLRLKAQRQPGRHLQVVDDDNPLRYWSPPEMPDDYDAGIAQWTRDQAQLELQKRGLA